MPRVAALAKSHPQVSTRRLSVIQGCKELGIAKEELDVATVKKVIVDEFGKDEPELREVIPLVARRLLKDDG